MNTQPIGIFDSGIGGLTVLKELLKNLSGENYIYFGDTARIPYGEKTKEELIGFSRDIINFFISKNVKMVLMACNTSSATTLDIMKQEYSIPIEGLIYPTVQYISDLNIKKVGLMATSATVNSNAYQNNLEKNGIETFAIGCSGLVEIVEGSKIEETESLNKINEYLKPILENNVEKIILGCTHYPFLEKQMIKLGARENMFINPAECLCRETIKRLKELNLKNTSGKSSIEFYASSDKEGFIKKSSLFLEDYKDYCKTVKIHNF